MLMLARGSVVLRRDRTSRRIARLAADVDAWLKRWANDTQQISQITRCARLVQELVAMLDARAKALGDTDAFEKGRALDSDLAVIERLFQLYRDRFDQRVKGTDAERNALKAVDRLISSCMLQVQHPELPMPLAYLDAAYAPMATPRTKPPAQLATRDRKLAEALRLLPIPLIALPYSIVDEPWWMVLVAHEVGHHVQYDRGLVATTGNALGAVAPNEPAWVDWRLELFADAFAVVALGPTAIQAVVELEWDTPTALAQRRDLYPPVIVRLAVMAAIATRHLGFRDIVEPWREALVQLDEPTRGATNLLLDSTDAVADCLWNLGFADMVDPASPSTIGSTGPGALAVQKLNGAEVGVARGRGEPRRATALAFDAYVALATLPDDRRAAAATALTTNAVALMVAAGEVPVKLAVRGEVSDRGVAARVLEAFAELEA